MSNDNLFRIIEEVMTKRGGTKQHTINQMVYDVTEVANKQGHNMSTRDIYLILKKLKASSSRGAINRAMTDLQDEGRVEFVGKEVRGDIQPMPVPVYRVADA